MVHVEGPGGEELVPRERSRWNDHERLAIDRFRCPSCESPLELMEQKTPAGVRKLDEESCELVAVCRQCMVSYSREEWHDHVDTG